MCVSVREGGEMERERHGERKIENQIKKCEDVEVAEYDLDSECDVNELQ